MRVESVLLIALVSLVSSAPGCVTFSSVATRDAAIVGRESAAPLPLTESRRGDIHCDAGVCSRWYRLKIEVPGELQVEVHAASGPGIPDFDVRLEDPRGELLWGDAPTGHTPRKIERMLPPGAYYLVVASDGSLGGPLGYEAIARFVPAAPVLDTSGALATKRPRGQPRRSEIWMSAEILGVEGRSGLPSAVLLDAGSLDDWRIGFRGELLNDADVIATFSLVEVDDSRSRALLDAAPNDTVTFETRARVRVPLE